MRNVFYGLLIVLHLFGFIKQCFYPNLLTLDSDDYILLAENINNFGLPYSGSIHLTGTIETLTNKGLFASRPFLYSLFLTFTGGIGLSLYLSLFVQNVLSCFSVYIVEKLLVLRGFKINFKWALFGLIFFPSLWIYANWIMAETLFMFLLCFSLYFLLKPKPQYFLSAIFLSLAMLTKPVLIFVIYIWFIVFLWLSIKRKVPQLIAVSFIPMITLLMQIAINFYYTKAAIVSSMPGINLVQYNAYFTLSKKYGSDSAANWVDKMDKTGAALENTTDFKTAYNFKKNSAVMVIMANWQTYFVIHSLGSVRWFFDPGRFDVLNFFKIYAEDGNEGWTRTYYAKGVSGVFERMKSENVFLMLSIMLIFLWNILRFNRLLYATKFLFHDKTLLAVFSLLLVYFAGTAGPVASARFLLPAFPIILFWSSLCFIPKKDEEKPPIA